MLVTFSPIFVVDTKIIYDCDFRKEFKKITKDCCTKTVFSFNNNIYKQKDGVSLGSSLGPILANIIMAELEKIIVKPMIESQLLKFHTRCVDDTLLLAKEDDMK